MRLLKWLTVFVVAFIIAWIVIFTFIQDEFKQLASAQLLGYETPEIPVYLFVAGAFGLGFLLGLACLLVNYIALSAGIHKHKKRIKELEIDNLVQGHGEVILVGEVEQAVNASLDYLDRIEEKVDNVIRSGEGKEALRKDSIESTGLSRLPLHGQVQQIHVANLLALYDQRVDG